MYKRYSSDLQRDSSIEDQDRKCREYASRRGWTVLEDYVRSDEAVTGAAMVCRSALKSLLEDAKRKPRPFDCILIDDTSRLARNVADALKMVEMLHYHGVRVIFISQGIDTSDKAARQLLTFNGMMDEQYLVGLADKVHRGQEGRVLNGFNPGGKCYGYVNVPVEDLNRPGKYGRPAISGVRLEIHPEQAAVIVRIFQMFAEGMGLARISKKLNDEGVRAPQPPRTRKMQAWCPSSIWEMLRNEKYRGVHVWNRTRKVLNPETGRKISKARPKEEFRRQAVPEWRIVPDDLWNTVHSRIATNRNGHTRLGGMNRTEAARSYLFSGLLICSGCGSRLVIISGRGKRGYVRYGCPSHRYRGVCNNALTIRLDRLEKQLLAALEQRLASSKMIDYLVSRFDGELRKRLTDIQRQATGVDDLRRERQQFQSKARRLAEAIADAGHSPTLLSELSALESRIADLDHQIEAHKPVNISAAVSEVIEFVRRNATQLRDLLQQDASRSKAALARHLGQLVLKPKQTPSGPVYEVSGGIDLLAGKDVMQLVARDGIEPPTPAFSGPDSPRAKRLIPLLLSTIRGFIFVPLLEQLEQVFGTGFSL